MVSLNFSRKYTKRRKTVTAQVASNKGAEHPFGVLGGLRSTHLLERGGKGKE